MTRKQKWLALLVFVEVLMLIRCAPTREPGCSRGDQCWLNDCAYDMDIRDRIAALEAATSRIEARLDDLLREADASAGPQPEESR